MEFVGQSVARTASVERPLLDAPAVVAHAAAVDPFRRMFEPEVAHIIRLDAVDRFVQSVDLVHRTVVVEQPQLVIGGVVGAALFAQFHPPQPVTAHVGTAYQRKIGTEFGDARVVAHVEPPVEQVERPRLTAQAGHGAEIGGIDARRQTALVDGEDPLVGSQQQLPLPAAGVVERTGRPLVVGMVIHPFAEQQQRKSPVERRPDILLRILRKRHHTVVEQPVFGRKNREQPSVGTGLVQSSEKRPEEIGAARGSDAAVEFVAPQPLRQRRTPRREPFAVVAPQSVGTRPHDPFALVRPGQQHPHGRRREAFAVGQPLEGLLPHPIERAAHLLHPELVARTQKKEHVHLARQAADALVIIKVDAVERLKQHPLRRDVDFPESLGVIIETPGFLTQYTGVKNLEILADMKRMISKADIRLILKKVGLDPDMKKPVGKYSLGMRQRLGIAQAIMEDPRFLILDEPFNGLDKHGVAEIRELLLDLKAAGKTILLASHNDEDIRILCDHVYEMDGGVLRERTA